MTEKNFSYDSFYHSVYLNSPPEDVYKITATSRGLCKWFMGQAVYTTRSGNLKAPEETAQKGDTFSWQWLEKDLSITGKVLDAVPNEKFAFTFGPSFEVVITMEEKKGRTLLTLTQTYAKGAAHNDFAHLNCCVCWGFFLTNLKSVIEYGNDLRETLDHDESLINR